MKPVRAKNLLFICAGAMLLSGCQSFFEAMPHKKWGFIDKTGKEVIEAKFDDVARDQYGGFFQNRQIFKNFSDGLCAVRIGNKWGYIDKTGELAIPLKYDGAGTFSEGLACVKLGTKYGYIDKTGKEVISLQFDFPGHVQQNDNPDWDFTMAILDNYMFSDGLALARRGDKFGYVDKTGKIAIEPIYTMAQPFFEGYAQVDKPGEIPSILGRVFIDKTGKAITKPDQHLVNFSENVFVMSDGKYPPNNRMTYADFDGKPLFKQDFAYARPFSEGLAVVAPTWKGDSHKAYGYIDKAGKLVIPPAFDVSGNNMAAEFRSGRAIVSLMETDVMGNNHNLHGIIDKEGKWIVKPKYNSISAYCDGLARAFDDNKTVYLDMNGSAVLKTDYVWGNSFSEGLAAVMAK